MGNEATDEPAEAALDVLYGTEPGDFVTTRGRLARDLRSAGDPGAAKRVEAARRPTKPAWALNLLARRRPELIAALLERSTELHAAQSKALAGDPGSQRDATRAHREALGSTADAAVALLGAAGEAARIEIVSTLRTAAADPQIAARLRGGRLVRPEGGATGFPTDLLAFTPPPDELAGRRSKREREHAVERARAAAELAAAEAALRASSAEAEAATATVAEAERSVAARRAELEAATDALQRGRERAERAERERIRLADEVTRRRRPGPGEDGPS